MTTSTATAPRVQQYRTPKEARDAHPSLDRDSPMPKEQFRAITGICVFPRTDWVTCQLTLDGGAMCRTEHGNGWVMQRADGIEGFIGQDCARTHFGKDHTFHREAARAKREVRIDELVARLSSLLTDPTRREQLNSGFTRQQQLRQEVRRIRDLLPRSIRTRLQEMTRTGNRNVLGGFEYRERIEDKDGIEREVTKLERRPIGVLASLSAIDINAIDRLADRFRSALTALEQAQPSAERSEKDLRLWVQSIEDIDPCDADVYEAREVLARFLDLESLKLLCWLSPDHDEQLDAARAALTLAGGQEASRSASRKALEQWRRAVMDANNGRRFRV